MCFFKDNKVDVILKYNVDEVRSLKVYGEFLEYGNVWVILIYYGGIWVKGFW